MVAASPPESADSSSLKTKTWSRPEFEVGQIFRLYGDDYRKVRGRRLTAAQQRVLRDLASCRTGALGGHVDACDLPCGHERPAYNSCNHRMCPKCRGRQRAGWYLRQARHMLPVEYLHIVFTATDQLARLARSNPWLIYDLLFYAASQTLKEVGRKWLGVALGFLIVLHLWGQLLNYHPHCHCVLPAGGISLEDGRWISLPPGGTLPRELLRKAFQKYSMKRLKRLYNEGRLVLEGEFAFLSDPLEFEKWRKAQAKRRWIVHVGQAKAGGEPGKPGHAEAVIRYLARYVSGMVFSNHRLISISGRRITFSYKDYRTGGRTRVATLPAEEFIDRFLSHVMPAGMQQKRYYGFLGSNQKAELKRIRETLGCSDSTEKEPDKLLGDSDAGAEDLADGSLCPVCKQGRMVRGKQVPRPTVRQIMAMPFPDDKYVEKQRKRLKSHRRPKAGEQGWLLVAPAGELRQRLLPFGFT
jgi:hypothetical protein